MPPSRDLRPIPELITNLQSPRLKIPPAVPPPRQILSPSPSPPAQSSLRQTAAQSVSRHAALFAEEKISATDCSGPAPNHSALRLLPQIPRGTSATDVP